jgi:hypothetical protein
MRTGIKGMPNQKTKTTDPTLVNNSGFRFDPAFWAFRLLLSQLLFLNLVRWLEAFFCLYYQKEIEGKLRFSGVIGWRLSMIFTFAQIDYRDLPHVVTVCCIFYVGRDCHVAHRKMWLSGCEREEGEGITFLHNVCLGNQTRDAFISDIPYRCLCVGETKVFQRVFTKHFCVEMLPRAHAQRRIL